MGGVRRHPETYYTAFESLRNLHVESGQSVMVRGATSGVGVAFARRVRAGFPGVHLAGSTRSAGHAELLHRAGFNDMVFDVDGRLELEGHPFDRVLELIVLATLKDSCGHVREGGVGCITGLLGDQWCIEGLDPIMDPPANGHLTSFYSGNVDGERLGEPFSFVEEKGVDATPERIFSLEEMVEAHRYLDGPHGFGKVVVTSLR